MGWRSGRTVLVGVDILPGSISGGLLGSALPGPPESASRARPRARCAAGRPTPRRRGSRSRAAARATGRTASTPWRRRRPTSRIATRSPGSGSAMRPTAANTSSPEHSGPATVTGNRWAFGAGGRGGDPGQRADAGAPGRPAPAAARGGCRRRGSRRAGRRRSCGRRPARRRRRPGRRGTGPGSSRIRAPRVAGSARAGRRDGVRADAPSRPRSSGASCASYGMPSPPPASTSRSRKPGRRREPRRPAATVASTWAAERRRRRARSRPRTRGPQQARARARRRPPRPRARRSGGVHAELARAVVADQPDALEPRALSVTAARSRTGWRRPEALGDRRQPPQLAHATRPSRRARPPRRRRPAPRRACRGR